LFGGFFTKESWLFIGPMRIFVCPFLHVVGVHVRGSVRGCEWTGGTDPYPRARGFVFLGRALDSQKERDGERERKRERKRERENEREKMREREGRRERESEGESERDIHIHTRTHTHTHTRTHTRTHTYKTNHEQG